MRSITELLGLVVSGRPFKAKIRRNDRLTLVLVLYPPPHMAHKFSPTTANWITSRGETRSTDYGFERVMPERVDSRTIKGREREKMEKSVKKCRRDIFRRSKD